MGLMIVLAILLVTVAWAVNQRRRLRRTLASRPDSTSCQRTSPISLEELHAFRWELDHTCDVIARLRAENQR